MTARRTNCCRKSPGSSLWLRPTTRKCTKGLPLLVAKHGVAVDQEAGLREKIATLVSDRFGTKKRTP